ncbi:MAG: DUF1836 domain-containing protein [Lachnospiraceae bacterium]|nr:DUF1836 domain-containing protein [Lachnospiraceae bacterium]
MAYDQELVAAKLRRWENYIRHYSLPDWEDIPDIGLYMEQVVTLMTQYLNYLPTETAKKSDKEELFLITPAAINNYVRTRIMPEPVKKRYYRIHIAYLIMICTLKQSLSIAMLKQLIPPETSEEEIRQIYSDFVEWQHIEVEYLAEQLRDIAAPLYGTEEPVEGLLNVDSVKNLVIVTGLMSAFSKLLAQKLLLLDGKKLRDGEDISTRFPEE